MNMRINHDQGVHIGDGQGGPATPPNQPSIADQLNEAIKNIKMVNGVSDSMIDQTVKDAKAIDFPGMSVMAICVELNNGMYITEFSHPDDGEEFIIENEFEKARKKAMEKIRVLLEFHNKEMQINYPQILKERNKAPWEKNLQ